MAFLNILQSETTKIAPPGAPPRACDLTLEILEMIGSTEKCVTWKGQQTAGSKSNRQR